MKKVTRIIAIFGIEAVAFYLISLTSFLIFGMIKGIDPREGGFLPIPPIILLILLMLIVAAVYGIVSGVVVNVVWNYAARSSKNLFKISGVVGAAFGAVWVLIRYLETIQLYGSGKFLTLDNLYMFLYLSAAGAASTAVTIAVGARIFPVEPDPRGD